MEVKVEFSSDCPFRHRQCRIDDWDCCLDDGPGCSDDCHFPEECPLLKGVVSVSIKPLEIKTRDPKIAVEGWN